MRFTFTFFSISITSNEPTTKKNPRETTEAVELLNSSGVDEEMSLQLSEEFPLGRVKQVVEKVRSSTGIKNPAGYIVRALRHNYYKSNGTGGVH